MPDYEICYVKDDGSLAGKFAANCNSDMQAKILAHAMKLDPAHRIEVWDGSALVYQRPEPMRQESASFLYR
jgi:hypothetical protein